MSRSGGSDQVLRGAPISRVVLVEQVGVGAERHRWAVSRLLGDLDNRRALSAEEAHGFDLPLSLETHEPVDNDRLTALHRSSPERRLGAMLGRLKQEDG